MTKTTYLFPNLEELCMYIRDHSTRTLTPLRLHKSIYLLYAYYGAVMTKNDPKANKRLVDVEFQPWKYGPVITSIWASIDLMIDLKDKSTTINLSEDDQAILLMVLNQINEVSDYTLSQRTQMDDAFKKAQDISNISIINNDNLILEYIDEFF